MDPLTLAAIQGGIGAIQTLGGAIQRSRAEKAAKAQIEKLGPDAGILGFYNQALQRYGASPSQSAMYKRQMQNVSRLQSGGMRQLQRSGNILAGVPGILDAGSRAALDAEVAAEQQKNLRFGQLGSAAQMAAAEKRRPEELRLQMQLQKAAGGSQIANTGLSNIFGALQSYGTGELYRDIYGDGSTGKKKGGGSTYMGTGINPDDVVNRLVSKSSYRRKYQ